MATPVQDTELGRSARKRAAITDSARELFLRKGYAGTSMDDVAALARVSKQTVYKHFRDKQRLFTDLVTGDIAHSRDSTHPLVEAMPATDDVERDLRAFAREHLADVMQPQLLRMRRILIGEAERFPELAQVVRRRAGAVLCVVRRVVRGARPPRAPARERPAARRAALQLARPVHPAQQGDVRAPGQPPFTRAQLDRYADEGVRVFLAAYGVRGPK